MWVCIWLWAVGEARIPQLRRDGGGGILWWGLIGGGQGESRTWEVADSVWGCVWWWTRRASRTCYNTSGSVWFFFAVWGVVVMGLAVGCAAVCRRGLVGGGVELWMIGCGVGCGFRLWGWLWVIRGMGCGLFVVVFRL